MQLLTDILSPPLVMLLIVLEPGMILVFIEFALDTLQWDSINVDLAQLSAAKAQLAHPHMLQVVLPLRNFLLDEGSVPFAKFTICLGTQLFKHSMSIESCYSSIATQFEVHPMT